MRLNGGTVVSKTAVTKNIIVKGPRGRDRGWTVACWQGGGACTTAGGAFLTSVGPPLRVQCVNIRGTDNVDDGEGVRIEVEP